MSNYFNTLSLREKLAQLGQCRFMNASEFETGIQALENKKIVILGCGAQGLNQGLNMRDSGLDISYALRSESIEKQKDSYKNAVRNGFPVDTFEALLPTADVVCNLTPDKQHAKVVAKAVPLMKKGATLSYSHGFNIVEEGQQIRDDITVIMVAPKCPGSEVREEYKRGFGVPTLIAVHPENDPQNKGWEQAKAYAYATGGHRAGVLASSFVAEVKSDLMGEQTILCGVLQVGSILCYDTMRSSGMSEGEASKQIQFGWETLTEALKHGGITHMMNRLSNEAKIRAYDLSEELKTILRPLFEKHMDDIMSGEFSEGMMQDWEQDDRKLLQWRSETAETAFEKSEVTPQHIPEQTYFDRGVLQAAFIKSGVELAFDTMVASGIISASAYYESLHELPLIANTIARKKLYEMNRIISDTAEYGCYLFAHAAYPLLVPFMEQITKADVGMEPLKVVIDNQELIDINESVAAHAIELIGKELRSSMTQMKAVSTSGIPLVEV